MNIIKKGFSALLVGFLLFTGSACTKADLNNILGSGNGQLADSTIVAGLKQALTFGTDTSVAHTSVVNGYFGNPLIKIPFPQSAQNVATALEGIGLGSYVDNVVLTMNRAAERAAKSAQPIFWNAIVNITITDGLNILNGDSTAATEYLQAQTYNALVTAYAPSIDSALNSTGATAAWSTLASAYNLISSTPVTTDLGAYTVQQALNGLFFEVGLQEKAIRRNPAQRVTALLQQVFAGH